MSGPALTLEIEVLEGRRAGARDALALDEGLCLGRDLACELVLLDRDVPERALRVTRASVAAERDAIVDVGTPEAAHADVVHVEVLGDGLSLDGRELARGERLPGVPQGTFASGTACWRLSLLADASTNQPPDASAVTTATAVSPNGVLGTHDARAHGTGTTRTAASPLGAVRRAFGGRGPGRTPARTSGRGRGRKAVLALVCGIGTLALVGASWWLHRAPAPVAVPAVSAFDVDGLLARHGFDTVRQRRGADGTRWLEGRVETRARRLELVALLAREGVRLPLRTWVEEEIVAGVSDVFRTHSLDASVESVGPGLVRATLRAPAETDVDALVAAAREDVAGLEDIEVDLRETASAEASAATDAEPPVEAPGKRVVAVIEGDPSYVVTADDTRYFVGSSLPTGQIITAIEDSAVTLDRAGELTRMEF